MNNPDWFVPGLPGSYSFPASKFNEDSPAPIRVNYMGDEVAQYLYIVQKWSSFEAWVAVSSMQASHWVWSGPDADITIHYSFHSHRQPNIPLAVRGTGTAHRYMWAPGKGNLTHRGPYPGSGIATPPPFTETFKNVKDGDHVPVSVMNLNWHTAQYPPPDFLYSLWPEKYSDILDWEEQNEMPLGHPIRNGIRLQVGLLMKASATIERAK